MGLDDEPPILPAFKNLCAIPTHLCCSRIRREVKSENGDIAAQLNFWINEFIAVDPYFSPESFVVLSKFLQAVQTMFQKRVEVYHIRSAYLQIAGGIPFAPSI